MAGGNLSPRQKMINLMYLIFISMLALNMSKEVLSAFGLMNEKFVESNTAASARNLAFMEGLDAKVEEQPAKYKPLKAQADQIEQLASNFNTYIADLKSQMVSDLEDDKDYETMDKGDFLDEYFFIGDKLKPEGEEFVKQMNTFREGVTTALASNPDMAAIIDDVNKKFNTDPVENRDGIEVDWLEYNYKYFPLIASVTKLTSLQSDVKTTQSEVLSSMLAGKLKVEASLTNFEAIVVPEKTAFFNGENFKGKIILGKKDKTLRADKVVINGRELSPDAMQDGQTLLDFPAGAVGERDIKGEFQFREGDSIISIPVVSSYAVVNKPNSATISADKMNVVYRGVVNPMTITFAGVSSNNIQASAPGLSKLGKGRYEMRPGAGKEVKINVVGTLPDGSKVTDNATFRIKDIPKPTGTIIGKESGAKLPRRNVEIGTIGAKLDDFDFDLPIEVQSFVVKIPGQASIKVNGTKFNKAARDAMKRARRGDAIQILDIKAKITGNSTYKLKSIAPVIVELTN